MRFGKIVDEDLNENFGDYVNIDKAVERLAEKLQKEQEELELKLSNINKAKDISFYKNQRWIFNG